MIRNEIVECVSPLESTSPDMPTRILFWGTDGAERAVQWPSFSFHLERAMQAIHLHLSKKCAWEKNPTTNLLCDLHKILRYQVSQCDWVGRALVKIHSECVTLKAHTLFWSKISPSKLYALMLLRITLRTKFSIFKSKKIFETPTSLKIRSKWHLPGPKERLNVILSKSKKIQIFQQILRRCCGSLFGLNKIETVDFFSPRICSNVDF